MARPGASSGRGLKQQAASLMTREYSLMIREMNRHSSECCYLSKMMLAILRSLADHLPDGGSLHGILV